MKTFQRAAAAWQINWTGLSGKPRELADADLDTQARTAKLGHVGGGSGGGGGGIPSPRFGPFNVTGKSRIDYPYCVPGSELVFPYSRAESCVIVHWQDMMWWIVWCFQGRKGVRKRKQDDDIGGAFSIAGVGMQRILRSVVFFRT